jgi:hypothetical protein
VNPTDLWKPLLLYTGLLGLLTVGPVYLATYSGFAIVVLAGAGVVLAALGGGAAGAADGSGVEHGPSGRSKGGEPEGPEATGLMPYTDVDTPFRVNLFFYGLGVLVWSLVVLSTLRDTLA